MTTQRRTASREPSTSRLQRVVALLRRQYGAPSPPVTRDPFELILWEQVAYLADDERRLQAFNRLKREVGLTPTAILRAFKSTLTAIARLGGSIAVTERAERMQRSARIVIEEWDGDLETALALPDVKATRALAKFPMIGAPGAEKILLIVKRRRTLPLESNGLRVLLRLGYGTERKSYAATYRAVQDDIAGEVSTDYRWLWNAHQLLRRHGQELCKRTTPRCMTCAVRLSCPYGQTRVQQSP